MVTCDNEKLFVLYKETSKVGNRTEARDEVCFTYSSEKNENTIFHMDQLHPMRKNN